MTRMTKDEALRFLTEDLSMSKAAALRMLDEHQCLPEGALKIAREALRREVAKEAPERPSLEEQEMAARNARTSEYPSHSNALGCAADTLKIIREQVVPWLRRAVSIGDPGYAIGPDGNNVQPASFLLHALGETP